jgi:hypothetical protein
MGGPAAGGEALRYIHGAYVWTPNDIAFLWESLLRRSLLDVNLNSMEP